MLSSFLSNAAHWQSLTNPVLSCPAGSQDRDHAVCILQVALSTPKQVTSHEAATQMEAEVFRACAENGMVGTRWAVVVT